MSTRDYKMTLPANTSRELNLNEPHFLFLKDAPADILVTIDGHTNTMEKGDKRRFDKEAYIGKSPDEKSVKVYLNNPNSFEQAVHIISGQGDFEKIIVTGRVTSVSGILNSLGEELPDTRVDYESRIRLNSVGINDASQGDLALATGILTGESVTYIAYNGFELTQQSTNEYRNGHHYMLFHFYDMSKQTGKLFSRSYPIIDPYGNTAGQTRATSDFRGTAVPGGFIGVCRYEPAVTTWYRFFFDGRTLTILGSHDIVTNWAPATVASDQFVYDRYNQRIFSRGVDGVAISNMFLSGAPTIDESYVVPGGNTMVGVASVLGNNHYLMYDNITNFVYEFLDGEYVDSIAVGNFGYNYPRVVINNFDGKIATMHVTGYKLFRQYYADQTEYARGSTSASGNCALITNDHSETVIDTPLQISTFDGKTTASGEVIKVAVALQLKMYTTEALRSDYLDYVYGIEFFDGNRDRKVSSGYNSFLALEIEDNFTVDLNRPFKITVREGLI